MPTGQTDGKRTNGRDGRTQGRYITLSAGCILIMNADNDDDSIRASPRPEKWGKDQRGRVATRRVGYGESSPPPHMSKNFSQATTSYTYKQITANGRTITFGINVGSSQLYN